MVESKISSYEIDPYEPLNVKQNVKMPTDSEIPMHTKPSQAVQKPKGDFEKYICHFCNSIAVDPILDLSCCFSFCRVCAASNIAKESPCPIPDCGEIFELKELTNFQKKEFDRIIIACDEGDCKEEYPFNQTLAHRRKCCVKKTSCLKNCGDGKLYKGIDAHLAHVNDECSKTIVICKKCRFKCAREDFDAHNCVIGFIN